MVDQYFLLFITSLMFSLILVPVVRKYSIRFDLLDHSKDPRKIHKTPVPRLGGIGIFFAVLIPVLAMLLLKNVFNVFRSIDAMEIMRIFSVFLVVFCIGFVDDVKQIQARYKFVLQVLAAAFAFYLGFSIDAITLPFSSGPLYLGVWSLPFTILWFVGITNAFNLIDGVDGLAAGLGIIASSFIFVLAVMGGHSNEALLCIALIGALLGFLRYNFNPASIFMGDSGSMFIGFSLALLSMSTSQKSSMAIIIFIPFFVLGIPILDTIIAFTRRSLAGKPIFSADREHIHHKLLDMGFHQRQVTFILYGFAALLGFNSLIGVHSGSRYIGYSLLVVLAVLIWGIRRIGYAEFLELFRYIVLGLPAQGRKLSKQITLRKSWEAYLTRPTPVSLDDLFSVLSSVLISYGFDRFDLAIIYYVDAERKNKEFSWQGRSFDSEGHFSSITLPIQFNSSGLAYLTMHKMDTENHINVRFSLIFEDLPCYLRQALEKCADLPYSDHFVDEKVHEVVKKNERGNKKK
ncbi:undecaprenyl/decaprenyl-phosphate alpha-N-acetylglucosaminyl 1-phosphate transferase [bacterium]|nr:undecaprenyl/decaprenyl-phosphate alpha-N-acetylglucosaminyl 1-phosphate transferase [bacterium]